MKIGYIRQAANLEELMPYHFPKWMKKCLAMVRKQIGKIQKEKFEENEIYILPVVKGDKWSIRQKRKTLKRLLSLLEQDGINNLVLSNSLKELEDWKNAIYAANKNILSGNYLWNCMLLDIITYIVLQQQNSLEKQEITVLVNDTSEFTIQNLILLAMQVRSLKIVTNHIGKFTFLEEYLYEKMGIMITITDNKRKSLKNATIIINMDFPESLLKNYVLARECILININVRVELKSKAFHGIVIQGMEINLDPKNREILEGYHLIEDFDKKEIYESLLYHLNLEQVKQKVEKDGVRIEYLIGNNGKISKQEYEQVSKSFLNVQKVAVRESD